MTATTETLSGWLERHGDGWRLRKSDGSLVMLAVEDSGPDLALFLTLAVDVSGELFSGTLMVEQCEVRLRLP